MVKLVTRALLALALGIGMLPFLSPAAQAATYTLTGRVTGLNASGATVGIEDVRVEVENWLGSDVVSVSANTDATGNYSLTVPRTGAYSYAAFCQGSCTGYGSVRDQSRSRSPAIPSTTCAWRS